MMNTTCGLPFKSCSQVAMNLLLSLYALVFGGSLSPAILLEIELFKPQDVWTVIISKLAKWALQGDPLMHHMLQNVSYICFAVLDTHRSFAHSDTSCHTRSAAPSGTNKSGYATSELPTKMTWALFGKNIILNDDDPTWMQARLSALVMSLKTSNR